MRAICACCKTNEIFNRNHNSKYCKNCSDYIYSIREGVYGKYYRKARIIANKLHNTINELIK